MIESLKSMYVSRKYTKNDIMPKIGLLRSRYSITFFNSHASNMQNFTRISWIVKTFLYDQNCRSYGPKTDLVEPLDNSESVMVNKDVLTLRILAETEISHPWNLVFFFVLS